GPTTVGPQTPKPSPGDDAMTFSIAALCDRTGEYGCALTTSSMAAGGRAAFVGPGVGVGLSPARSDPRLGVLGWKCLEGGGSAEETLVEMASSSPNVGWRQLAVVDVNGGVAAHTGGETTLSRGHLLGRGVVALGNGLANDGVVPAILAGYE